MVPLSLVNRSIGIAKNEILVGKSVYIGRKAVAESSKGQEWSLLEQGIIQKNWLLQARKVNIKPADFSKDTLIFTWKGIRQSSANTACDRQLLQGATGQLFPANTLTAVGDAKHLDRLDWSKRQEKTYCTSLFPFIFLQDLLCCPRSPSPCKS